MISNNANAGIIFEHTTNVTRDFQNGFYDFDITGFEDYTNITLNVNVRGDYGDDNDEYIYMVLNGVSYGFFYSNSPGVSAKIEDSIFWLSSDTTMSFSLSVTPNTFLRHNNILAEKPNLFRVGWANGDNVRGDTRSIRPQYVSWKLSGDPIPAPEPSTLAILALGMIGLASRRFKKQS
jgi:hypothetical protein